MYVRAFKAKNDKDKSRTAVYLETIETGSGKNQESAKMYFAGNKAKCEIDAICAALPEISLPESQKIIVFTENHEIAWDFQCIKNGEAPEFLRGKYWNNLLQTMAKANIPLEHIDVKEDGLLKQAVTIRAREYISSLAESNEDYARFT